MFPSSDYKTHKLLWENIKTFCYMFLVPYKIFCNSVLGEMRYMATVVELTKHLTINKIILHFTTFNETSV